MTIDTSLMGMLKAHVSNEIPPIKWQSEDPGERQLEAVCAVIGHPYQPPKGYSPLRRWLRQERARTFEDDLPPPPESRPFTAHFTAHFTVIDAEIEAAIKRQRRLWAEAWYQR